MKLPCALASRGGWTTMTASCPARSSRGIMHLPHVTAREEHELGMALRWSYSSVFGLWHGLLRRRAGEPLANVAFGATLMPPTLRPAGGSRVEPANRRVVLIWMLGTGRRPSARCSRCASDLPLPAHSRRRLTTLSQAVSAE